MLVLFYHLENSSEWLSGDVFVAALRAAFLFGGEMLKPPHYRLHVPIVELKCNKLCGKDG